MANYVNLDNLLRRLSVLFGLCIVLHKTPISQGNSGWWFDQPIRTELCYSRSANTSEPQTCYQTPGPIVAWPKGDVEAWCNQWAASLIKIENDDVRKEVESFLTQANFTEGDSIITSATDDLRQWSWVNGDKFFESGFYRVSFYDVVSGEWQANESVVAAIQVRNMGNESFGFFTARRSQLLSYFICNYPSTDGCANRNSPAMLYFETTCYSIHNTQKVTWWQARNLCISYGGDLSVVFNNNFNYLIDPDQLTPNTPYWIGLYREQWVWTTMKGLKSETVEMKYSNWAPLAPKDGSANNCMCLSGGGQNTSDPVLSHIPVITTASPPVPWQWVDCDCGGLYQVVCQRIGLSNSTPPPDAIDTTPPLDSIQTASPLHAIETATFKLFAPSVINTNNETQKGQQNNNSMTVGLGVGLGLGLFICLLIILCGLYLSIYRRNRSEKVDTIVQNIKHFTGIGSSMGKNSKDLASEREDVDDALSRKGHEPPLGYEKLQKSRPCTSPPFFNEDGTQSGFYEEIPDTPRISVVIENPRDSGFSTVDTSGNSKETSDGNFTDAGYSSSEVSGDSAGLRTLGNSKVVDCTGEYLNKGTFSTEKLRDAGNCQVTKNPSEGENFDDVENTFYHGYYNKDVISSRDSYLSPVTPAEVPASLISGEYLHPFKANEDGKQLEDYEGSVHKSPSDDYTKYLEIISDI